MKSRLVFQLVGLMAAACVGLGVTLYHFRLPLLDLLARRVHTDFLPPCWVEALAEHHLAEARANLAVVERQLREAEERETALNDSYYRFQREDPVRLAQVEGLRQAEAAHKQMKDGDQRTKPLVDAYCALQRTRDGEGTVERELLQQRIDSWNLIRDLTRRRDDYRRRILKLEASRQRLGLELEQRHAARFGVGRAEEFFQAAGVPEVTRP